MVLLLQLNGELPDRFPSHDRRLYVFACRRKTCRRKEGSIRALRGIRATTDTAPAPKVKEVKEDRSARATPVSPPTGLGEALFGVKQVAGGGKQANPFSAGGSTGTNPFSKPSPATAAANPFSKTAPVAASQPVEAETPSPKPEENSEDLPKSFAETLSLNNPQESYGPPPPAEPWPPETDQPAPYPIKWLSDAEFETLDPTPSPRVPTSTTAMDIDSGEGSAASGKEDKEVFESSMDSAFQRFADRVGQNPDQCIRYEYAGQPLLYSKADDVGNLLAAVEGKAGVTTSKGMPRCSNCGGGRVFEVQLTPHAIEELESEEDGLDGMDWGTIIVGVCEKDCQERGQKVMEAGYIEEWAGVQWEELIMKR